jgi:hypothetical protein
MLVSFRCLEQSVQTTAKKVDCAAQVHTSYFSKWRALLALLFMSAGLGAEETTSTSPDSAKQPKDECVRIWAYEPNWFAARWSQQDERTLRGHLSIRYDKEVRCHSENPLGVGLYLSLTTDFDFYWLGGDSRSSAPVISHRQNV